MSKYIINNCPAYCYLGKECHNEESKYGISCCEVTDCKLKQIVELCEEESSLIQHKQKVKVKGLNKLADKIFELLDIQEVE